MWTLRLRDPKGKAATVEISPQATMKDFCTLVARQLAMPNPTNSSAQLTFRSGFPPRMVEYSLQTTTVQSVLCNNDAISVSTSAPPNAMAPPQQQQQAVAPSPSAPSGRPSRAAATAATSTITAEVHAVAAAARAEKAKAAAKAKAKAIAKAKAPAVKQSGVHTLGKSNKKPPPPIKRKDRGDRLRLGASLDEESVVVEPAQRQHNAADDGSDEGSSPSKKYRRTRTLQLTSKDDIGIQLAQAVSGQSQNRIGKFFRAATKSAVEHQYEMTLANARLSAALSNKFEITQVAANTTGSSQQPVVAQRMKMRVKFKETARKWKEEDVEMLEPMALQASLKYILISGGETGKEMLKPFNMAQCSPRVFWSIARLYHGNVAAGLAELLPEEDWSYLDTRTRQISDKAKEAKANEEVYKQWKTMKAPTTTAARGTRKTTAAAAEGIEIESDDQEEAADHHQQRQIQAAISYATQVAPAAAAASSTPIKTGRYEMARAALARLQMKARAKEVSVAMQSEQQKKAEAVIKRDPDETDTDEEREEKEEDEETEPTITVYCDACAKARILSLTEADAVGASHQQQDKGTSATSSRWTCEKLSAIHRNPSSCDALDDEIAQIAGVQLGLLLQQQATISTRQELANVPSVNAIIKHFAHPLDANYEEIKQKLIGKIDEARLDEINDAMEEIVCDTELVGKLELQKLGTPADLVETPADLIVLAMQNGNGNEERKVEMETVSEWQRQAKAKLAKFPWMGEWRTV